MILLIVFTCQSLLAGDFILNPDDQEVYNQHYSLCSGISNPVIALATGFDFDVIVDSFQELAQVLSADREQVHYFMQRKGRNRKVAKSLKSIGFYKALNDCYGESKLSKDAYALGYILSDSIGKIGLVSTLVYGVKYFIQVLGKFPRLAKVFNRISAFLVALTAVSIAYEYNREPNEIEKAAQVRLIEESFTAPRKAIDNSVKLIKKKLALKESELLNENISMEEQAQTRKSIEELKSIIEEIESMRG